MPSNPPTSDPISPDGFAILACAASTAANSRAAVVQPRAAHSSAELAPAAGVSVLIVEDDPPSARLLAAHLRSAGCRPTVAHSAAEAEAAMEGAIPDVILCDVCLPGVDGIEFTRALRSKQSTINVPIALITSSDDSKILARGLEAGADDFLAKPVNALELRTRVRSLMRSKLLADELRGRCETILPAGAVQPAASQPEPTPGNGLPVVLIVEDCPQDRRLLEAYLTEFHFQTHVAPSVADGWELARKCRPDLIVLDLLFPDGNGYDFIARIKSDPRCSHVPMLVVSAMSDVQDRVKALELGADDFIVRGFDRLEFEARTRRLLRLKRSLDQLHTRCDQALKQAVTDSLTGLYTQGFMRDTLQQQLQLAERCGQPYSAIFADIDHFKQVNDRYGHVAGDAVLRAVATTLRDLVRQSDALVRYGGEEFVALLPHTDGNDAIAMAERMRTAVAALRIPVEGNTTVDVTMSLGVASYPADASDGQTLVQRGDAAMYLAKRCGRNRTVACGSQASASLADSRVLLIADAETSTRTLEAYLIGEGYQLLHTSDPLQAVQLSASEQPDVIIVDATVPQWFAVDVCRRLKQDPKTQCLPILMITTPAARDDKRRGIEAGVDEFISQPIDKLELATRVRALVRHKRDVAVLEDAETVVFALAQAVEDRDPLLANHMERVAELAVCLGRAVALTERNLKALWCAGRVHDIGKIAVPDAILFKQGPLSPEEFAIVREHPDKGYRLLVRLRTFGDSLPAVRFHHERLDGSGYPLGLRGKEVPLLAQILAIADVFDALTARRHYRAALAPAKAVELLREDARRGLHDPTLVETFVSDVLGTLGEACDTAAAQGDPACDTLAGQGV